MDLKSYPRCKSVANGLHCSHSYGIISRDQCSHSIFDKLTDASLFHVRINKCKSLKLLNAANQLVHNEHKIERWDSRMPGEPRLVSSTASLEEWQKNLFICGIQKNAR